MRNSTTLNQDGSCQIDVDKVTEESKRASAMLNSLLGKVIFSSKLKKAIYSAIVQSIILHGSRHGL